MHQLIKRLHSSFLHDSDAFAGNFFRLAAGGPIGAVGLGFTFIASILGAVAGCAVKGLPGIGEGACCCVATKEVVAQGAGSAVTVITPMAQHQSKMYGPASGAGMYMPTTGQPMQQPMMAAQPMMAYMPQQQQVVMHSAGSVSVASTGSPMAAVHVQV